MALNNSSFNPNDGVRRVIIITEPVLYPQSAAANASKDYFCKAIDMKGFQIEIDLQALPPGVTYNQIKINQVWWVEKRTTRYRLYLYGGIYDPEYQTIDSTNPFPGIASKNSTWFNYSTSGYFVSTTETTVITSNPISGFTNYLVFFKAIQSVSDSSWHTISARIVPSGAKIVGGATDIYQIGTSLGINPGPGTSYSNSIDFTMPVTVNTTGPIQLGVNLLAAGGTTTGYSNIMLTIMGVS